MPHPLSNDLRERVVAFVEAGHSCHEAAARFDTSVSFVVNLMALWRETGSVAPRPAGGRRHGKLDAAEAFLLAAVARAPDITMPELAAALLCLIPGFDGAIFSPAWKEALWARFFMGAPPRLRRSVERYSIVKRA